MLVDERRQRPEAFPFLLSCKLLMPFARVREDAAKRRRQTKADELFNAKLKAKKGY